MTEQPAALRAALTVKRLRRHLLTLKGSQGMNLRTVLEAFAGSSSGAGNGGGVVLRQSELDAALGELGFM